MPITLIRGSAEEAKEWVNTSTLPDTDKGHLLRFIYRFPDIEFYKQTLGGNPPGWFVDKAAALAGVMKGQLVWVKFDSFDYQIDRIPLLNTWYRLALQAEVDSAHPKVYVDERQLYFVGVDMEEYATMLAIIFDEKDKKVYEFKYADVRPNVDDLEDYDEDDEIDYIRDGFGHIERSDMNVAFDTYSSMFGHIIAIRLQDGREFTAND